MSTTLSKDDQFDSWLAAVSAACGRYDAIRLGGHSQGAMSMYRRGALELATIDIDQTRLKRRQEDVKGDDGKFYFMVAQLNGQARMEQGSNRNMLLPGDLMLLDSARPSEFQYDSPSRQFSLIIPRDFFSSSAFRGSINAGVKVPATSQMARMTRLLVDEAIQQPSLGQQESEAVLAAVVSLLAPVVGTETRGMTSQQKAFQRAMTFIEQNLHLPDLNPAMIAKEVGISLRGLYRCFAEHDIVVAKHIRDRRLDVCAELIRRKDNTPITELAHTWGFNEPSHFSTLFKARFNITPSEYRLRYADV